MTNSEQKLAKSYQTCFKNTQNNYFVKKLVIKTKICTLLSHFLMFLIHTFWGTFSTLSWCLGNGQALLSTLRDCQVCHPQARGLPPVKDCLLDHERAHHAAHHLPHAPRRVGAQQAWQDRRRFRHLGSRPAVRHGALLLLQPPDHPGAAGVDLLAEENYPNLRAHHSSSGALAGPQ